MDQEEIKVEETSVADLEFYNDVKWDLISFNKISKDMFLKVKAKNDKLFATFLGDQGSLSFYMFRPLPWSTFKDIRRSQESDKYAIHDEIIKSCLIWPMPSESVMNTMSAGTVLTLVYQILAQSSFLKDPAQALKMIIEI